MELVQKKSFPVSCENHLELLEKADLVQGHLNVLLYALRGFIEETGGDTGHLRALEGVADSALDSFCELKDMIQELRD